jgi:hypothetical protein
MPSFFIIDRWIRKSLLWGLMAGQKAKVEIASSIEGVYGISRSDLLDFRAALGEAVDLGGCKLEPSEFLKSIGFC